MGAEREQQTKSLVMLEATAFTDLVVVEIFRYQIDI